MLSGRRGRGVSIPYTRKIKKLAKRRVISTTMNNMNTPAQQSSEPMFRKTIGKTTYLVSVHFSRTSKETIKDKIMRLLRGEAMRM